MAEADDLAEYQASLKDSKFLHLLKPIRDLAENWNIDIANELEEYLTHLDRTGFSFDGGPSLDFAEAALLIQSSACVYSKKVEYLHNLVFQALDVVRTKRRKEVIGEDDAGEAGMGDEMHGPGHRARSQRHHDDGDDSLEAFLSAGDYLDECDDIDLEEDADAQAPTYNRPPAALLALEDQGTGLGDGDAGVYRLAQCHMHISGALLLDYRDGDLYDQSLGVLQQPCSGSGRPDPTHSFDLVAPQQQTHDPGMQQQPAADCDDDDCAGMQYDAAGFGDDGDDDDDGGGAHAHPPDPADNAMQQQEGVQPDDSMQDLQPEQVHADAVISHELSAEGDQPSFLRGQDGPQGRGGSAAGGEEGKQQEEQDDFFDPFEPLDPDAPGNLPIKPMQVSKPKGKRSATFAKRPTRPDVGVSGLPLVTGLVHQEFAYAAELMQRSVRHGGKSAAGAKILTKRQQQLAEDKQPGAAAPGAAVIFSVFDRGDAEAATQLFGEAAEDPENGGADDAHGTAHAGDGGMHGDSDEDHDNGGPLEDAMEEGEDDGGVAASDILAAMQGTDRHLAMDLDGASDPSAAAGGQSYEDLCRMYIDLRLKAAAAREVQTELAQRVSTWRQRIDPVLKAEESKKTFDLQLYGERILGTLVSKVPKGQQPDSCDVSLGFNALAECNDRTEVSRTFAAMLQLINNRNVSLSQQQGGPDAPFELQLLTVVQPHKHMAERMRKPKGHMVPAHVREEAEGAGRDEEELDVNNEEEKEELGEVKEEREGQQRPARAAKKGRKGEGGKEEDEMDEVEEGDSDGENQDVNVNSPPEPDRKAAKGGRKGVAAAGKGPAASKKGAAAAPARPMAKRTKA